MNPEIGNFVYQEFDSTQVEVEPKPTMVVVGRGAVGRMIAEAAGNQSVHCELVSHDDVLKQRLTPEIPIVLAIPNYAVESFITSLLRANPDGALPVIVLLQNGVGVVEKAQQAAKALDDSRRLPVVRASVFTQVSLNEDRPQYNSEKLRIALAPAGCSVGELYAIAASFEAIGFAVRTGEKRRGKSEKLFDYRGLEWLKLLLNSIGSLSIFLAAGKEPVSLGELLSNEQIFALEIRAFIDRRRLLNKLQQQKGIQIPNIDWSHPILLKAMKFLKYGGSVGPIREMAAGILSAQRNDRPSAASERVKVWNPAEPDQSLDEANSYFRAWLDLADWLGEPHPPVDLMMVNIMRNIKAGHMGDREIIPVQMSLEEKKAWFLKMCGYYSL